MKFPHY